MHIAIERTDGHGGNWIVRVYKKTLLRKKIISSDWFLDEAQAKRFADQISKELSDATLPTSLRKRVPGWTLHRPR
jgi:hypothetical protein